MKKKQIAPQQRATVPSAFDYCAIADSVKKRLLDKGTDHVVVHAVSEQSTQLKFSNNRMSVLQSWDTVDIGVFIALKKKIASTSIKDFEPKKIDQAIDELLRFTQKIPPNHEFMGIAKGPCSYPKIDHLYDSKSKDMSPVDFVEASINKALEMGAKRCAGLGEIEYIHHYVTTSGGIETEEQMSSFNLSLRALLDKYATGHSTFTSRTWNGFDYLSAAEEAGRIARDSKNPTAGKAGQFDVIFSPLAFAPLLDQIGGSASIFSVESGLSFFTDVMNKTVAPSFVTIYDDATFPGGIGSGMFDAEGHPSQRTPIIEKGVFKNYLHNTSTATRYKTKTTGNAGMISPDPRNIRLVEGKEKKENLFSQVKNGLWITNTWYTRFQNHSTGEFSTIPRDGIFWIKNGKIEKPVKEIRISETMGAILKNIAGLARDAKNIISWEAEVPSRLPYVLVKNVNITKPVKDDTGA